MRQSSMEILEFDDRALVLANSVPVAGNQPEKAQKATSVFKKCGNVDWRCVIENFYGHDLISSE